MFLLLFCYTSRKLVFFKITASNGNCIQFPIFSFLHLNNCNGVKLSPKYWQNCFKLVRIRSNWVQYLSHLSHSGRLLQTQLLGLFIRPDQNISFLHIYFNLLNWERKKHSYWHTLTMNLIFKFSSKSRPTYSC